jgi:Alkylmercury lyase
LATLVILTADELMALGSLQRQAAHLRARRQPLVRLILRTFLEQGGPIPVEDIIAASRDTQAKAIHDVLATLDDEDIIRVRAGHIDIAYPFSAAPTAFRVRLAGGRERYACCATDALGMAPMVGEPIEITSLCHHCGVPLRFTATPHGVSPAAAGVMVWFGKRVDEGCKAADSL